MKYGIRILLVTTLFFIAAYLAGLSAAEIKTFRFGVCLSTTGEFAAAGKKALAGIRIRLDDFNADSEATGIRLEMVFRDNRSSKEQAVANFEELAQVEKVPAVIGPLSTNLMMAMRDTAQRLRVVLISPSVTNPAIGRNGDWCFRVLFDDEFQGVALARFLRSALRAETAGAVVNSRLNYSNSVFAAFKRVFEEDGGKVVAEERYEWIADEERPYDFSPILNRIADARPDIVLLPVNSIEVAAIIRESLRVGLSTRFCGGDTWQHESVLLSSGNNVEGSYFISGINFESKSLAMRRWLALFDRSNDPDAQRTSVLGYDALSLLIEALKRGDDGPAIREGMYAIRDFELATGTITIDRERGSEKTAFIHRIEKSGGDFVSVIVDEIKP